jgi:hypothetical protein
MTEKEYRRILIDAAIFTSAAAFGVRHHCRTRCYCRALLSSVTTPLLPGPLTDQLIVLLIQKKGGGNTCIQGTLKF